MANSSGFPRGKASYSTAESRYPALNNYQPSVCIAFCVTIPAAARPTLIRQMDMGSLTCAQMCVCHTHEGGSGTNMYAQELTRRDRKTVPHPAPTGDRTQGLPGLNYDDILTTELLPDSCNKTERNLGCLEVRIHP